MVRICPARMPGDSAPRKRARKYIYSMWPTCYFAQPLRARIKTVVCWRKSVSAIFFGVKLRYIVYTMQEKACDNLSKTPQIGV